jgi:hypothetical protein
MSIELAYSKLSNQYRDLQEERDIFKRTLDKRDIELEMTTEAFRVAIARVTELEIFIKNIHDNYDCDSDQHKYHEGFGCRCCDAKRLLD